MLFPGMEVVAAYPFRVLRDADFEIQVDEAGDLLATVEQGLRERRFGSVVTLTRPGRDAGRRCANCWWTISR